MQYTRQIQDYENKQYNEILNNPYTFLIAVLFFTATYTYIDTSQNYNNITKQNEAPYFFIEIFTNVSSKQIATLLPTPQNNCEATANFDISLHINDNTIELPIEHICKLYIQAINEIYNQCDKHFMDTILSLIPHCERQNHRVFYCPHSQMQNTTLFHVRQHRPLPFGHYPCPLSKAQSLSCFEQCKCTNDEHKYLFTYTQNKATFTNKQETTSIHPCRRSSYDIYQAQSHQHQERTSRSFHQEKSIPI